MHVVTVLSVVAAVLATGVCASVIEPAIATDACSYTCSDTDGDARGETNKDVVEEQFTIILSRDYAHLLGSIYMYECAVHQKLQQFSDCV